MYTLVAKHPLMIFFGKSFAAMCAGLCHFHCLYLREHSILISADSKAAILKKIFARYHFITTIFIQQNWRKETKKDFMYFIEF